MNNWETINTTSNFGLTESHLQTIKEVLRPFAKNIDEVKVFGSRATGTAKANSDIDISILGDADTNTIDRIWTLLNESSIPFKVDVISYNNLNYAPLKKHIDDFGQTLISNK
jgi:predicted nucleotidyltransferase